MKKAVLIFMISCFIFTLITWGEEIRPTHTYSIVAYDKVTGQLGAAVQSHWFSVGSIVPWAESGVGAVVTQSFVEVSYGPLGLNLLKAGKSAQEALTALVTVDKNEAVRQVAMVDAQGRAAAHTGKGCIPEAGQYVGEGFSCQANMMLKNTVWKAMAQAYKKTQGELADSSWQPWKQPTRKEETSGENSQQP